MSDIILKEVSPEANTRERVSLKAHTPVKQKEFKIEKVELSPNIQTFDKRPRVFTSNPYSQTEVIKSSRENNLSPDQAVLNPLYNRIGHMLGVDMPRDWKIQYDKVVEVVKLAEERTGFKDPDKLASWIFQRAKESPSMSGKRIMDVLVNLKMGQETKSEVKVAKPKVVYKTVYKYVKPKQNTEDVVNRWMQRLWA